MSGIDKCGVYERIAAGASSGACIRPGGIELTERALALCAFHPGSRLLDVGCGTGATVEYLIGRRGFSAAGVDPSFSMIERGCAGSHAPLIRAEAENLPFPAGLWDGVLFECSLSVTADPDAALRECRRVLKPGGKLILSDVYVGNAEAVPEIRALPFDSCLTGAQSREALLEKLNNFGFVVLAWEDHSSALKYFAAQLILSGEPAPSFWCSLAGADPSDTLRIDRAIRRARLGYFLAIAEKPADIARP